MRYDAIEAVASLDGSSRAIHLAGVNRGSDDEVRDGNVHFAQQFAEALRAATVPPPVVVYSNSTQAGSESPYGFAKEAAGAILADAACSVGAEYIDLRLPNLFGEHGRPFYNSVVATFSKILATGGSPTVEHDRELSLLHAQDAADLLIGQIGDARPFVENLSVAGLLDRLETLSTDYATGEFPGPVSRFDFNLLNTYRSFAFEGDSRLCGEMGASVTSVIPPGGSEFGAAASRSFERLAVVSGQARISVRRLVTDDVVEVVLDSQSGMTFDLPTLWSHAIVNAGDSDVTLQRSSLAIPDIVL